MPTVFDKLNLKDQREILVINAPASFEPAVQALEGVHVLREARDAKVVHFALAFATTQAEVDTLARSLVKKAAGDVILWFAYPKGSSKKYQCAFNRDTGWDTLRSLGFDTVRAVAIDEDWSALRFRRVEFIGSSGKSPTVKAKTKGS
ncbi:MAG: hypothetical protein ABI379_07325 [Rhodanobacter sp.]